ncbi:MAG: hypothetical protein V7K46_00040 [Nostoc sp.]
MRNKYYNFHPDDISVLSTLGRLKAFWLCVTLVVIQFINLTRSLLMMQLGEAIAFLSIFIKKNR